MSPAERGDSQDPRYEVSEAFPVEGYDFRFTIWTVTKGFHIQMGKVLAYMMPGEYVQVAIGSPIPENGLSEKVVGAIYDSIFAQLDQKRNFPDDDGNPLVEIGETLLEDFGEDTNGGNLYFRVNPPNVAKPEDLDGMGISSNDWGFPDRVLPNARHAALQILPPEDLL